MKWKGKGEKKRPNEIRSNELADYEISPESETLWCYCNPLGLLLETPEHITLHGKRIYKLKKHTSWSERREFSAGRAARYK